MDTSQQAPEARQVQSERQSISDILPCIFFDKYNIGWSSGPVDSAPDTKTNERDASSIPALIIYWSLFFLLSFPLSSQLPCV